MSVVLLQPCVEFRYYLLLLFGNFVDLHMAFTEEHYCYLYLYRAPQSGRRGSVPGPVIPMTYAKGPSASYSVLRNSCKVHAQCWYVRGGGTWHASLVPCRS